MRIITDLKQFNTEHQTAVAIGKFDGVHVGHRYLLDSLMAQKSKGLETVVFTFSPSPAEFFGFSDNKVLTTDSEKEKVLEEIGIDWLIEYPFNQENADVTAYDFISEVLVKKLNVAYIVAGEDLSFGKGGAGNMDMIVEYAEKYNFKAEKIMKVTIGGKQVSSTLIRNAIAGSDMKSASSYLGTPYFIDGVIAHGAGLGHTIGFPTINLIPPDRKILPANGVYYSKTCVNGNEYNSITNVGVKPTVAASGQMCIETYIYDFNQDVYGLDATVSLLEFKRSEQHFSGVEELKSVLMKDIEDGRNYFMK